METNRVALGLIARTLPKSEWTHNAHLRAGLWHILHYPDGVALEMLRKHIRSYNESTGVANTASSGYHETITRFYVHMIRTYVAGVDLDRPIDDLAEELIARFGARDLPLKHYSHRTLFSAEARSNWVAPDLEPLPRAFRPG